MLMNFEEILAKFWKSELNNRKPTRRHNSAFPQSYFADWARGDVAARSPQRRRQPRPPAQGQRKGMCS